MARSGVDPQRGAALSGSTTVRVTRFRGGWRRGRFPFSVGLFTQVARRSNEVDILHVHNLHSSVAISALLTRSRGIIISPHFHGRGHTPTARALHKPYDPIAGRIINRADRIVCVSGAERAKVVNLYAHQGTDSVVIPNGVDIEDISRAPRFVTAGPTLLVSGRLERYKQVDRVIDAVGSLPEEWSAVVTGTGPERKVLERRAREIGVDGRVRFLGHVPEASLRSWQRTATVFITMSEHESFGLGLVEALAAGARVIASDIPSHREVAAMRAEAVTFVSTTAGPAEIAASITEIASRPNEGDEPEWSSWFDVAKQLESLYEEALSKAR